MKKKKLRSLGQQQETERKKEERKKERKKEREVGKK